MGDPSEKETKAPDALAAAVQPGLEERNDTESEGSIDLEREGEKHHEKIENVPEEDGEGQENGTKATRLQTTRSAASAATATTTTPSQASAKKPWYKKLNPLGWGTPPPVPEARVPSREHQAGFFSKLTFQWMTQLMTVSNTDLHHILRPLLMGITDGVQTSVGIERHVVCQPRASSRANDKQSQGVLSQTDRAR